MMLRIAISNLDAEQQKMELVGQKENTHNTEVHRNCYEDNPKGYLEGSV
jgi:hypothetical protein